MNSCQEKRRKNKQCVDCGKQDENTLSGKCRCFECQQNQREKNRKNKIRYAKLNKQNREYYKSHNRCTVCGKQDAYTLSGHSRCADCQKKASECNRKYNQQHKDEISAKKKEKYMRNKQYRLENHLCTVCGKKLDVDYTYNTCQMCRHKSRNRQEKERIKNGIFPGERGQNGVCYLCNKEKATHGKLCDECFEKAMKGLQSASESIERKKANGTFHSDFYDMNNAHWVLREYKYKRKTS